jgi:Fur family ferric uptake transcriptional regulator
MKRRSQSATRGAPLITAAGGRATPARQAVLEVLLAADKALSHQEIEQALENEGSRCDRVTLYRVLEWLVSKRLAHKVVGDDRLWRFNTVRDDLGSHPHFQCTHCRQVYCLEDLRPPLSVPLPPGFRPEHAEIMIQGTCPACEA